MEHQPSHSEQVKAMLEIVTDRETQVRIFGKKETQDGVAISVFIYEPALSLNSFESIQALAAARAE